MSTLRNAVCLLAPLIWAPARAGDGAPPHWLKLGGESRGRLELATHTDFERGLNERYYLNRLRLNMNVEARPWLRFLLETQDARALGLNDPGALDGLANRLDFRQACLGLGSAGAGWQLKLGRQELSFGDERLLAADSHWDPLGPTWDAARLTYQASAVKLDWVAAWLVPPERRRLDRPASNDRLYGLYATLPAGPGGARLEPYFLFDDCVGHCGREQEKRTRRVFTYGARNAGRLPGRLEYNLEMALQRGLTRGGLIRAWAGHWELSRQLGSDDRSPRAGLEYNYASGDARPDDGRRTTFDDLHPAGYNKFGMADPFAWRNISNLGGAAEWEVNDRWRVLAGLRSFWLPAREDGLYTVGEACLVHNPAASSSHVGSQISLAAGYEFSPRWQLYFGYARFFPGAYLRQSSFDGPLTTPYVTANYRF